MQQLTLALPDLAWPHPQAALPALHTPGLNRLLHWGRSQSQAAAANSTFFGRFLWQGALLKQGLQTLGLPESQAAFWCSPVHQHIGMHSAQIISGNALAIQADEAAAWCAELTPLFCRQRLAFSPLPRGFMAGKLPAATAMASRADIGFKPSPRCRQQTRR
jgi:hypothetical protein